MKATSLKTAAILAGSIGLFAGSASAQTATTEVVGYETLELNLGFNFVGLRLHQTPTLSGDLEVVNANSVVDNDNDLGALMDGSTFILEIEDGQGIIQEVTMSDGGMGLATADTSGVTAPVSYTLRPADTLASVFGENNEAGLATGTGGGTAAADEIWLWNGSDFDKYYYDTFNNTTFGATWSNVDTGAPVTAADIDIIYADGFIINSRSGTDVVVSGDLKTTETEVGLATGFNFVSSVAPVGQTLETAFGAANEAGLATGTGGGVASADEVWVPNGSDFDKYYYDTFNNNTFGETWSNVNDGSAVTAGNVALTSGYIINAKGVTMNVTQGVPAFYAGL